jgi:sugar lactone lactonase YvrE
MQRARVIQRPVRDQLGEGLLWSQRENAVYWVDILQRTLRRLSLADESVTSWPMPDQTRAVRPAGTTDNRMPTA